MTEFVIEPHVGPVPIRFGMSPQEVEAAIGPPTELLPGSFENRTELWRNLALGYDAVDDTLIEAVFSPGASVLFGDRDLFSVKDLVDYLRQFDDAPQCWVGFVIFLKLGIRLSGFHHADESQKAIGVVKRGYWDEYVGAASG